MNEDYAAIMDSIKSEERVFVERLTRIEEKLNIHLGSIQKDVDNAFNRLRTNDERLRVIEDVVKKIELLCPTKFDPWKKIQESFFAWLVPALFAMAVFAIQHGFTK